MVCTKPLDSVVANQISHGLAFGDSQAHNEWLTKQRADKSCGNLEPGRRFITSPATAVYLRSVNNVAWVVQVLVPTTKKSLGYVPLSEIRFIPIPSL